MATPARPQIPAPAVGPARKLVTGCLGSCKSTAQTPDLTPAHPCEEGTYSEPCEMFRLQVLANGGNTWTGGSLSSPVAQLMKYRRPSLATAYSARVARSAIGVAFSE